MKLNKKQLRKEINKLLLNEGFVSRMPTNIRRFLEDAPVYLADTALPGYGDAAMALKAVTVDLGRVVKDMSDLEEMLKVHGINDITLLGAKNSHIEEAEKAAASIRMAPEEEREAIIDEIYFMINAFKGMVASLVAAIPVPMLSTAAGGFIRLLPVAGFYVWAADFTRELMNLVEKIPGGEYAIELQQFMTRVMSSPAGWLFGDPVTAFISLGIIIEAAEEGPLEDIDDIITPIANTPEPIVISEPIDADDMYKDLDISKQLASLRSGNTFLTEARFLELSGINMLNEVSISGYNVEINDDGSITIGENTYELTLKGVSKNAEWWAKDAVKAATKMYIGNPVEITEIIGGSVPIIKGAIGSLSSELPLKGDILNDLTSYITSGASSFTLHGPKVAINFKRL